MKLVIFGLSISSSWGNGHATLWRGLVSALINRGFQVVFFERDVPYYAENRDFTPPDGLSLILYRNWHDIHGRAESECNDADAGIVTSYCPDGRSASGILLESGAKCKIFYDLDTPVTIAALHANLYPIYLPLEGLGGFDLVLSFTGGGSMDELKKLLGARTVLPLYGSVDPGTHFPVTPSIVYKGDLSYLGTYAPDRHDRFRQFILQPSSRLKSRTFVVGGAQYPDANHWPLNVKYFSHIVPPSHPEFYCSSTCTLNITREAMRFYGYCPSGRLFEAAACKVPIITDSWDGLETFFKPGSEIIVAENGMDVIDALHLSKEEYERIAQAAYDRVLFEHTAVSRALQFEALIKEHNAKG